MKGKILHMINSCAIAFPTNLQELVFDIQKPRRWLKGVFVLEKLSRRITFLSLSVNSMKHEYLNSK